MKNLIHLTIATTNLEKTTLSETAQIINIVFGNVLKIVLAWSNKKPNP
jgi:hypothetical protein